ncbi:MAG TPA: type II toxin-antitoxin system RelE/ParE family toxin [Chromatiales bacterium]|nr:type II toxin-antitoxin system RelE/ParE family toxin [Thiotrichales bacterium]HIP68113.1 type II toxin-antitoxin system RelE/ParE family toxin [Chromatiales bacterium]
MSNSYLLTPEADNDLVSIWLYTFENWGREQANTYLRELEKRFLLLAKNPDSGKPRDNIRSGYFSYHQARHVIFFRVNKGRIEIVRILHDRMDFNRHL